jgi:hypothetical protein
MNAVGIELNDAVAETLGITDLWEAWDGWEDDEDILGTLAENYSVNPWRLKKFREEKGGETTGISGFEDNVVYILFDTDDTRDPNWVEFSKKCAEAGSESVEGSWAQLM